MIVIKLAGGLGNQMFNYAFAKFLQKHGYKVVVDISWFQSEGKKHSEGKKRKIALGGGALEILNFKVFHSHCL